MNQPGADALKKEFRKWVDDDDTTGVFELDKCDAANYQLLVTLEGEDDKRFVIKFPSDYPNTSVKFAISAQAEKPSEKMASFVKKLSEYNNNKKSTTNPPVTLKSLLTKAADIYLEIFGEDDGDEGGDDDDGAVGGDDDDLMLEPTPQPAKKAARTAANPKLLELEQHGAKKFLEIGSASATLRILTDLKNIYAQEASALGFSAEPVIDKNSGLQNLYHWQIKLFGFDPASNLGKDFQELNVKHGIDHVLLEMRFSKDYPHVPPFVRVVRPKFAFRTGHVTVGGSICMELLTTSGWSSINDIESILIQIRSEMMEGGAQLDRSVFMNPSMEYAESEAWDAFYRAARGHNWKTEGLGPQMFPKPK